MIKKLPGGIFTLCSIQWTEETFLFSYLAFFTQTYFVHTLKRV